MKTYKKLIKMPSIGEFRTIVADINRHYNYVGDDENGVAIYDTSKHKPTILFTGSCKLHGSNGSFSYNNIDGLWTQSKVSILTIMEDNAGCAFFVENNKEACISLIKEVSEKYDINLDNNNITIYFEWTGKGIQSRVAISTFDKGAFIIGIKVSPFPIEGLEKQKSSHWVDHSGFRRNDLRIYNILDFKTFSIEIDFNDPESYLDELSEMTISVEDECPVSKELGVSGMGEGIVFTYLTDSGERYSFKSKGLKHAGPRKIKVKKIKVSKSFDDERAIFLMSIADKVTPEWRLAQMIEESCHLANGGDLDRAKIGIYIKLVLDDIVKEDSDILFDAGTEPRELFRYVAEIAKNYFFQLEKF